MTLTPTHSAGEPEDVETPDLNGGRAVVAAILAGAGSWALLVGIALTLWT